MLAWRYWVWWLLIFPVFSLSAQPPLVVGAATVTLPIENTLIFFDSTGCLTDSVVTNPRYLTHFQPHEGSDFRLGKLGEKNAWVVFSVKNASPKSQKMILEMPLTRLAFGSCAIFEATPNGLYRRTQQIGRHWQDNIRPFIHSYQAAIELPAASEQKIYLKFIDGKFRTLDLSLRLSTPAHFERTYTSSLMFITAWLSALFLLLAISAVSFIFNMFFMWNNNKHAS